MSLTNQEIKEFDAIQEWPSVVVDINDPMKRGRIRVRNTFYKDLETEDLPWATPRASADGSAFIVPPLDKVVNVCYPSSSIYLPEYLYAEHHNINLQTKLETLTEQAYQQFKALAFSARFQFYIEPTQEGMILDYVKSRINITPNGNIIINLRNQNSTLFLGSQDADQSAMLGDHFLDWFDKLMENLMGVNGGPYIGNMMSPVIANPGMLQVSNEYFALRERFLSRHVKVVDNFKIVENDRAFDLEPEGDEFAQNEEQNEQNRQNIS